MLRERALAHLHALGARVAPVGKSLLGVAVRGEGLGLSGWGSGSGVSGKGAGEGLREAQSVNPNEPELTSCASKRPDC